MRGLVALRRERRRWPQLGMGDGPCVGDLPAQRRGVRRRREPGEGHLHEGGVTDESVAMPEESESRVFVVGSSPWRRIAAVLAICGALFALTFVTIRVFQTSWVGGEAEEMKGQSDSFDPEVFPEPGGTPGSSGGSDAYDADVFPTP